MYRICLGFLCVSLFFASCVAAPTLRTGSGLVRFGAGSVDETNSSDRSTLLDHSEKAQPPAMFQKVRVDDTLAIITTYEGEIDDRLTARDYSGAIECFDRACDVAGSAPASLNRINALRDKLESALGQVAIEVTDSPAETVAGTAFKKGYTALVFAQTADAKVPLANFPCVVSYPGLDAAGKPVTLSVGQTSAADGSLSYAAPVPERSGRSFVSFALDLTSRDGPLQTFINSLKEKGRFLVSSPHTVSTNARKLATSISIVDFDRHGKPVTSSNVSATTLLMPLVKKGFNRIGMADFVSQIASGDDESVLKAARAQFGKGVQRFIYGTTRIESLSQTEDGSWACTVSASVTVQDMTTDTRVYHTELRHTGTAKTESAAIDATRKRMAGELLVNDLFYNM